MKQNQTERHYHGIQSTKADIGMELHNINQLGILESSLVRLMSRAAALSTRYPQESVATSYPIRKSGSVLQKQEKMQHCRGAPTCTEYCQNFTTLKMDASHRVVSFPNQFIKHTLSLSVQPYRRTFIPGYETVGK